ncbi:MAG: 23S rRNA (adenine(2503)-C(2))-methyltransferase RlmN [Fusobacteria bacterium]|nr:23S rRNA (adenine(2503)-C(2))-methyltransferase RlmN [Fusobacteriota bacterium]
MNKVDILALSENEIESLVVELGGKKFTAKQVFDWLHNKLAICIDDMTNLPKDFRDKLNEKCEITRLKRKKREVSKLDNSVKFLFELADQELIETVLMKYKDHMTLCVSSQVGCAVNCVFCQTGKGGFVRNLTATEIVNQYYEVEREVKKSGGHVRNIVFMGMGEPLLNLGNVVEAITILGNENGQNVSIRRISVSTAGILPGIEELLIDEFPLTLSISLHATTDEQRSRIMPINKRYSLKELIETLRLYQSRTGRKITFEYILIKDFNMTRDDANRLREITKSFICNVNLIPYNPIENCEFESPGRTEIERFTSQLERLGVNVTLRASKGRDIQGACGQLRKREIK